MSRPRVTKVARKKNILNCWNPLKPTKLQHDRNVSVKAEKSEKISGIIYG